MIAQTTQTKGICSTVMQIAQTATKINKTLEGMQATADRCIEYLRLRQILIDQGRDAEYINSLISHKESTNAVPDSARKTDHHQEEKNYREIMKLNNNRSRSTISEFPTSYEKANSESSFITNPVQAGGCAKAGTTRRRWEIEKEEEDVELEVIKPRVRFHHGTTTENHNSEKADSNSTRTSNQKAKIGDHQEQHNFNSNKPISTTLPSPELTITITDQCSNPVPFQEGEEERNLDLQENTGKFLDLEISNLQPPSNKENSDIIRGGALRVVDGSDDNGYGGENFIADNSSTSGDGQEDPCDDKVERGTAIKRVHKGKMSKASRFLAVVMCDGVRKRVANPRGVTATCPEKTTMVKLFTVVKETTTAADEGALMESEGNDEAPVEKWPPPKPREAARKLLQEALWSRMEEIVHGGGAMEKKNEAVPLRFGGTAGKRGAGVGPHAHSSWREPRRTVVMGGSTVGLGAARTGWQQWVNGGQVLTMKRRRGVAPAVVDGDAGKKLCGGAGRERGAMRGRRGELEGCFWKKQNRVTLGGPLELALEKLVQALRAQLNSYFGFSLGQGINGTRKD